MNLERKSEGKERTVIERELHRSENSEPSKIAATVTLPSDLIAALQMDYRPLSCPVCIQVDVTRACNPSREPVSPLRAGGARIRFRTANGGSSIGCCLIHNLGLLAKDRASEHRNERQGGGGEVDCELSVRGWVPCGGKVDSRCLRFLDKPSSGS